MRKVVVYIAMSLDGYIADKQGGVGWLGGDGPDQGDMGSYPEFIETVDTVILGYKTYHQIVTELSPEEWNYGGKASYVLTHRGEGPRPAGGHEIYFTDRDAADLVSGLKRREGKDIWICGGASVVNQLADTGLIDRWHITVIPTILGDGVRLFANRCAALPLRLVSTAEYGGMVDLVYEPRK